MTQAMRRSKQCAPPGALYHKSIRETAKELGLTRQQVVEAEKRALKKLREGLKGWQ
jgi:DNA-directed RNA polymerase sigma subunit (sigma70/sigma32)